MSRGMGDLLGLHGGNHVFFTRNLHCQATVPSRLIP